MLFTYMVASCLASWMMLSVGYYLTCFVMWPTATLSSIARLAANVVFRVTYCLNSPLTLSPLLFTA
jgi:hypothetical protein